MAAPRTGPAPQRACGMSYRERPCQPLPLYSAKMRPTIGRPAERKVHKLESGSCPCVSVDGNWQATLSIRLETKKRRYNTESEDKTRMLMDYIHRPVFL
jgi:hypothetical protein